MPVSAKLPCLLLCLALSSPATLPSVPCGGAGISWDASSRTVVFARGGYARMIQLCDGRLMAVCEHEGINAAYSSDKGKTWSAPEKIVRNSPGVPNCTPDLLQLRDGTIIVAYNPRPSEPYTPERRFGIRCIRSTDGGRTWSGEIFVNDAGHEFCNGCWEPSMLELPTGELQLYFADEGPYVSTGEQQISLCRSFDGGATWASPEKVSFRAGHRDGMPVPALLADGRTIAVAIEDNGWEETDDFLCTTVRCDTSVNWRNAFVGADDPARVCAIPSGLRGKLHGGAPYLRVLPGVGTVLSWQSACDNGGTQTMYTAVGDAGARRFGHVSAPFGKDAAVSVMWNSLAVVDSGCVVAVGGVGGRIEMIKGYPPGKRQPRPSNAGAAIH